MGYEKPGTTARVSLAKNRDIGESWAGSAEPGNRGCRSRTRAPEQRPRRPEPGEAGDWRLDFGNNVESQAGGTLYHLFGDTTTFIGDAGELVIRRGGDLLFHFVPG